MIDNKNIVITSKGPYKSLNSISKVRLEESYIQNISTDKINEIISNLHTYKKFAYIKEITPNNNQEENTIDTIENYSISTLNTKEDKKEEQNPNTKEKLQSYILDNNIIIKNMNTRLNNYFAVFMNKNNDYITAIDNTKLIQFEEFINNIPKKEDKKEEIKPVPNYKQQGYINFTLLLISTTFLSILSVMLGLLILGK